jgi:tetratricopeptide (TPR) repeat protein
MKKNIYSIICGLLVFITVPAAAQKITPVYSGTLRYNTLEKLDSVKKEFSDMLGKVYSVNIGKSLKNLYIPEDKEVVVKQDGVSFNVTKKKEKYLFLYTTKQEIKILEYSYLGKEYEMVLPDLTLYWRIRDLEFAKRFADDLVYFQNMQHFVNLKDVEDFDLVAAKYRALKEKPPISEDERKFIVQANAMTQSKNYNQAIEFYEKAILVDPTNPMVYNNQALLFVMVGRYDEAINRMKKYLKLVPDAPDARSAQDKIYEWEAMMAK